MTRIADYLDPKGCPERRPTLDGMDADSQELHRRIDDHIRACGIPYLHPEDPTVVTDRLGSQAIERWQQAKAEVLFSDERCWSELPPIYGRYGTDVWHALIERIKELEQAEAVCLTDCGMQACALVFDAASQPGFHSILLGQVYNKTKVYLERLAGLLGGELTMVPSGDDEGLRQAIRPNTSIVFAETFSNPLLEALDPRRLGDIVQRARGLAPNLRLVIDDTIATPWAFVRPLLSYEGVGAVVASGTKALGGQDRDLWGYVATRDVRLGNQVMDLQAMRGGILDWRRAQAIEAGLEQARGAYERRCTTAAAVAEFLAEHPQVEAVYHPSLRDHQDAPAIERYYRWHGSLLSFRVRDRDEARTRHLADVLATCTIIRYALSFDGLVSKVNHHSTVSEYFTPAPLRVRAGIDRLIRLGVGLESPEDLIACLNWTLWHGLRVTNEELTAWQQARAQELGLGQGVRLGP